MRTLEVTTHMTFCVEDSVLGVGVASVLGGVANKTLIASEGDP